MKSVVQVAVAVLSVGFVFPAVCGLQAADWPAWRYDAGRTAASPHGLPDDLQLLWMAEYPAPHRAWMEPLNQQRMQGNRMKYEQTESNVERLVW